MKYLLMITLLSGLHTSYGQIVVNGNDINKLERGTHIQVEALEFNSKITVTVDYGQEKEFDGRRTNKAKVYDGSEPKTFKSPVDALNFFLKNRWELVDFSVTVNESVSYVYLLKRQ